MPKTIVIFCGGTGGHVLPSVNFGNYLIENGYNCILITDKRGNKYTDQFVGKIKIISSLGAPRHACFSWPRSRRR